MSPLLFYQQQAEQQQAAADASSLQNVRERCQRASDAWTALAARIELGDKARLEAASQKAGHGTSQLPNRRLPDA